MTFICRTKKHEKKDGFTENVKRQPKPQSSGDSRAGSATTAKKGLEEKEKTTVEPGDVKEDAALAIVSVTNLQHDDLKVQMMARACYPDLKISKQELQFGECASNARRDYALTVTNRNEDLALDFLFQVSPPGR